MRYTLTGLISDLNVSNKKCAVHKFWQAVVQKFTRYAINTEARRIRFCRLERRRSQAQWCQETLRWCLKFPSLSLQTRQCRYCRHTDRLAEVTATDSQAECISAVKLKFIFLPARCSKRGTCYGNVADWLAECLTVTHRYCMKTAKAILKLFRPPDSPVILVSSDPCADTQFQGEPLTRSIAWWHFQWPWRTPNPVFKVTAFLKSNISKTVHLRDNVTIEH